MREKKHFCDLLSNMSIECSKKWFRRLAVTFILVTITTSVVRFFKLYPLLHEIDSSLIISSFIYGYIIACIVLGIFILIVLYIALMSYLDKIIHKNKSK